MATDRGSLVLRYAAFAALSIAVNWLAQLCVLRTVPEPFALYLALFAGTAAGFGAKYLLDRNYVFRHVSIDHRQEFGVMALYLGTSVLMTALYLLSQAAVYRSCGEGALYYVSGTLVLSFGYTAKFILDGRFVFRPLPGGGRP